MSEGPMDWGRSLYERVLGEVGAAPGRYLLDVGCGAGQLCRLAVDRGMLVTGVDHDPIQLNRAAALVPEARLRRAELTALPVPDGEASAVSCVQVLMHLPNPLAALRELARVAAPGAPVVVTVWGPPERCAIGAFGTALTPLFGPPPWIGAGRSGSPGPEISADGRLGKLVRLAGFAEVAEQDVLGVFDYPDERAMVSSFYASEIGRRAVDAAGRPTVRRAVLAGLAGYQRPDGSYRMENTFRMVRARMA